MQKDIKLWHFKREKTTISIKPEVEQQYTKFIFMTSSKVEAITVKAILDGGKLR